MLKPTQLHRVRCLENGCVYQMLAISDLRNHLANHHLKPEYKKFILIEDNLIK